VTAAKGMREMPGLSAHSSCPSAICRPGEERPSGPAK
jgi:hypothetical protein